MTKVNRITMPRAFRPHQIHLHDRYTTTCGEMMDAGAKDGLSQLERGHLTILDERTAHAMRVSLESALRDIAARFGVRAGVIQAVAHHSTANFVVVLSVEPRS